MIAGNDWDFLLAGDVGSRVAACLSRRRIEYSNGVIWLNRIPEGVFELGKFFLVSRAVADTQVINKLYPRFGEPTYEFKATIVHVRMEWARHCYREWEWAWEEFRDYLRSVIHHQNNQQDPYFDWWFDRLGQENPTRTG